MSYCLFNRQKLLNKSKCRYHNDGDSYFPDSIIRKIKKLPKQIQKVITETCQKKKKKQKWLTEEVDTET